MIPFSDNLKNRNGFAYITLILILINTLIFFFELSLSGNSLNQLTTQFALDPGHITLASLISYQFIHGGWLHLIGNMIYLWVFGKSVEDHLGRVWFLIFYLTAGFIGGLAQSLISPNGSAIIGASASIAGILGAYLVWFPYARVKVLLPIFIIWAPVALPSVLVLVLWFGTNLISGYSSISSATPSGEAYIAHIGGFMFGILIAFLFKNFFQTHTDDYYETAIRT